ncbi:MAG: MazG-like family protein [Candidatus Levyibacteriota bacterium]
MDLQKLQDNLKIYKKKGDNQFILYSQTEKEILTKTIKLNEEVGELCNDILSVLKLQRKSKLERFDERNFPEEFADVIITTLLLANDAGVEVEQAVVEKLKKLKKRYPNAK